MMIDFARRDSAGAARARLRRRSAKVRPPTKRVPAVRKPRRERVGRVIMGWDLRGGDLRARSRLYAGGGPRSLQLILSQRRAGTSENATPSGERVSFR